MTPINKRAQFIITKRLCLCCLTHSHMVREKKCQNVPSCVKWKQKHQTCLHDESRSNTNDTGGVDKVTPESINELSKCCQCREFQCSEDAAVKCTSICSIKGQQSGQEQILVIPVRVSSSKIPQNVVLTCALSERLHLQQTLEVDSVTSHLYLSTNECIKRMEQRSARKFNVLLL